jgi:hypothetical protein
MKTRLVALVTPYAQQLVLVELTRTCGFVFGVSATQLDNSAIQISGISLAVILRHPRLID